MAIKRPTFSLKKILIAILLFALGLFLYISYQVWHYSNTKPINSSQTYYKDPFGYIYEDATTGCLDICLFRTFKKLQVDINTFEVLEVKSPFTLINRKGELTESRYAKDKSHVFWIARLITEADPASFIAISYDLAKDKNQYFIYDKPLHIYLAEEFGQSNQFIPESLEVISYDPSQFIVLKANTHYYYVRLNPQPRSIEEITSIVANQYPKLQ